MLAEGNVEVLNEYYVDIIVRFLEYGNTFCKMKDIFYFGF